jgi:cobalt-zinc-cadmium efflux system outer membrane protein
VRAATASQVGADQAALLAEPLAYKLKLAGELRDIAASAVGAQLELELAERKLGEAKTLLQDTQRRVTSGDSPRIDVLQASAAERQAAGQISQARTALEALQAQWRVLTGLAQVAVLDDSAAPAGANADHPTLVAAQARVRAAQARLALTEADRRDTPELGVGITREKALAGDAAQNALRLSLRIPFGGTSRNAPRLAAARAELDTAFADFDTAQRQVQADLDLARVALQAAQAAAVLANERAAFSAQAQALLAKSYQLGESDLPTRLRADNDRFEADLAAARARADIQRATARLHQASGILP